MHSRLTGVAASLLGLAAVTAVIALLDNWIPVLSLAVLYLLAVLPVAIFWGIAYAVALSVASMLAFNFFFLPPVHTLTISDTRNWLALLVFVVTAAVVGELAARSRRRAEEASRLAAETRSLLEERERLAADAFEAEALRRADVLKTTLLRAVSHDLRTPLMAISTSASALASRELEIDDAGRDELLATIVDASDRLAHLVGNLLDLSRLQAGAAQPAPELLDLEDVVVRALEEVGGEGRVDVTLPDAPPSVRADAQQIQRVLVNLLENALKYSPADEHVHVHVGAASGEAVVRVVDHGPGVPAADSNRIFEPFSRGPRTDQPGAGLGLAIARGFAEANGGRVRVESRAGQGATFVLTLPLERAAVPA